MDNINSINVDNINSIKVRLGFMAQIRLEIFFFFNSILKLWEKFRKKKQNDKTPDMAQQERSNIKCYTSIFSNI